MHETAIIGGGLAALSLADRLIDAGQEPESIAVVDAGGAERASSAPTAIFHPFPGKSLAPKPRRLRQVEATLRQIDRWQRQLQAPPIVESTMVRPLRDDYLSERLCDSWAGESGYPDWFDGRKVHREELAEMGEHLAAFESAFVYRPAFAIDLDALCEMFVGRLQEAGVAFRSTHVDRLLRREGCWELSSDGESTLRAGTVILAVGTAIDTWFPELSMRSRGGELLHVDLPGEQLDHIVNAGGHVAAHPESGIVAGATYWNPANFDRRTSETARREILERCGRLYPPLRTTDSGTIWRGVRAMFGDHQPLVGPVETLPDFHCFGAFGSTGLLRIPLHAERFSAEFIEGTEQIPALSRPTRMRPDKWRPAPGRFPTAPADSSEETTR